MSRSTLTVPKPLHQRVKALSDRTGFKIYRLVEKAIDLYEESLQEDEQPKTTADEETEPCVRLV